MTIITLIMGERVDINRFFAEVNGKMIEIDKEEYDARKEIKVGD